MDFAEWLKLLKAAGCTKVYSEKRSGKSTDGRREFEKLMKRLEPGDVVGIPPAAAAS